MTDCREEIVQGNQTVSETTSTKTQEPSSTQTVITLPTTTTTVSPIPPSSENPTTLSNTTEPITQTTAEAKPDDTINYIVNGDENNILNIPEPSPVVTYTETDHSSEPPKVTQPDIKYETKEHVSTTSEEPDISYIEPKPGQDNKEFDPTLPQYFPYTPETNPLPKPAASEPKEYGPKTTIPDENEKTEISNTIGPIPPQTEKAGITPEMPSPKYPESVNVNIERDGTVIADRNKDNSVVVNTKDVSKECPPGLESDEYGACFGNNLQFLFNLNIIYKII